MPNEPDWYHATGDPIGTIRYWDGERWVGDPVPGEAGAAGAVSAEADSPGVPDPPSRRLTAAGVMHLVWGALVFVGPLIAMVVVGGEAHLWLPIIMPFLAAVAAISVVVGRACLRGLPNAWVPSIVVSGLWMVVLLPAWQEGPIESLIVLVWNGTIIVLSVATALGAGRPARIDVPTRVPPPSESA